jgi:integrase
MLVRPKPRPDRGRALSRGEVDQLLTRKDIGLRERTLWRMLYETAARSAEVLALDVGDLDLPNRCARVRRKGGAIDVIVWQTGTARLLLRLLQGRKAGPVLACDAGSVQDPERHATCAGGPGLADSRRPASIRSLIVTRPIVPAAFRKPDAIAVLTGPLSPARLIDLY